MTSYGSKEMMASFKVVRGNTLTIADEIPENQYNFQPSPDTRTVARTLVHIAAFPSLQLHIHQNRIDDLQNVNFMQLIGAILGEEEKPRTKAGIIAYLKSEGDRFTSFLAGVDDAFLAEIVKSTPGQMPATRSRLEMLLTPKEHEMHHRGQLMVMERMLGVVPHLTRAMQARLAQQAAAAAPAR